MIKTFMREAARDISTSMIGYRTKEELKLERDKQLTSPRWTKLDEEIKKLCGGGFRVQLDGADTAKKDRDKIVTRLDYLRKNGFCAFENGTYKVGARWEEDLRTAGRYNTFLQARKQLITVPPSGLRVYQGEHGMVKGKVTKVYRPDDESDNHVVVLECANGRAYFIPLFNKPEIKEGETVSVTPKPGQRGRLTPEFRKAGRQIGSVHI
jgi:hypothetical protein